MTLEPTPSAIPVWWYLTSWTWKPLKPPKLLLYFPIIRNPRNWGPHLHTRHRDCKRVPWIEHCWWWLGWGKNHFFSSWLLWLACLKKNHSNLKLLPFSSHEWSRHYFSLPCQYNINHTNDENTEKHQFWDI